MIRCRLKGPFLTRSEAAAQSGLEVDDVPFRPDLLRIGGRMLPEVYFKFQFGTTGIRHEIGTVVLAMRGTFDDMTIADWLVRSNPALRGESPLERLLRTRSAAAVMEALAVAAPQPPLESEAAAAGDAAVVRRPFVTARPARRPLRRIKEGTAAAH